MKSAGDTKQSQYRTFAALSLCISLHNLASAISLHYRSHQASVATTARAVQLTRASADLPSTSIKAKILQSRVHPKSRTARCARLLLHSEHGTVDKAEENSRDEDDSAQPAQRPSAVVPKRGCACWRCAPHFYNTASPHGDELQKFQQTDVLHLFQYDCVRLAELAIKSFDPTIGLWSSTADAVDSPTSSSTTPSPPPTLCFAQHHALHKWKDWASELSKSSLFDWCYVLHLELLDPFQMLRVPTEVFGQLFFLGQIPLNAQELCIQWSPPGTRRRAHSHTVARGLTMIWINPYHPAHFLSPRGLLDALLHELCHAFLQRYSCYLGSAYGCDGEQLCVELCREDYGATGHGRAWQMLAAAIEHAAPKLLDGWKVDIGRDGCTVREIARSGSGWWPSICDLEMLGHELGWKPEGLMRSHDDDVVVLEKMRSWVLKGSDVQPSRSGGIPSDAQVIPEPRRRTED